MDFFKWHKTCADRCDAPGDGDGDGDRDGDGDGDGPVHDLSDDDSVVGGSPVGSGCSSSRPARARARPYLCVPSSLVRSLGVGARRLKTDIRDARVLSEVSCRIDLPSVHIPKDLSREWKSICGMRSKLVKCRTALINCVRGWLRGNLIKPKSGVSHTFAKRAKEAALKSPQGLPIHVQRLLMMIEGLDAQIKEADQEALTLAESHPVCQLLMSTPAVGPVTALRFVAALDEIARFSSAHSVQAYLGLMPAKTRVQNAFDEPASPKPETPKYAVVSSKRPGL